MKLQNIISRKIIIGIGFLVLLAILAATDVKRETVQDGSKYEVTVKIFKIDIAVRY